MLDDRIQTLKAASEAKASRLDEDAKHQETLLASTRIQETILQAFASFVDYLENKVTKAEVINQLDTIKTPDVAIVERAISALHDTIKTHENTDLTEITSVMRDVLKEVSKIPKENFEIELPEQIDTTDQLKALAKAISAVEKAVKAQKTVVEAPVVNVDAPVVKVDAPDLKPFEKASRELKKAIEAIIIPVPVDNTKDLKNILKEQKRTNDILEELPLGGGGGEWTLISITDLSNATGSTTLSSIPAYDMLRLDVILAGTRVSGTQAQPAIRLNSDTGNNYTSGQVNSSSASSTVNGINAASTSYLRICSATSDEQYISCVIMNKDNATKIASGVAVAVISANVYRRSISGIWANTDQVDTIDINPSPIFAGGPEFPSDSTAYLYGKNFPT